MEKLVLFITLLLLTQQNIVASNIEESQEEDVLEWVYWNTFSETFIETSDVLKAESAALDAEDRAEEVVNAEEWLAEINSQESSKCQDSKEI